MTEKEQNTKRLNFWRFGKQETRKFNEMDLHPGINVKTFIFGLLLAAVIILPIGLMTFQFLIIFHYLDVFMYYLLIVWLGLLFFNGLSNYFTVKLAQAYEPNNHRLQAISAKHIFLYNCLNIGFAIFTFFILIVIRVIAF